jgi:hypothetical protein
LNKKPITKRRLIGGIIFSVLYIILGIAWIIFAPSAFEEFIGLCFIAVGLVYIPYICYAYIKQKSETEKA